MCAKFQTLLWFLSEDNWIRGEAKGCCVSQIDSQCVEVSAFQPN